MDKNENKINTDHWLESLPINAKPEGYKPEEMIACQKCRRNNPPNRLECMYCGVELEFDENQSQFIKPVIRKMDSHTKGTNLIYLANLESWDESQVKEVAKMTRIPVGDIDKIFASEKPLPIARAETEKEVWYISQAMSQLGLEIQVLEDEKFSLERSPRRLRGINILTDELVLQDFNKNEVYTIKQNELALIVVGAIFERKLESTEKYQKKGENKILNVAEISTDSLVIDIYKKDDIVGYRILPNGFDFSYLGADKKLLAIDNMKILISKLREFADDSVFDEDYLRVRGTLAHVWENEEMTSTKGLKRQNFGRYNKESVTTTSNLSQFTKYSRLQWLVLKQ